MDKAQDKAYYLSPLLFSKDNYQLIAHYLKFNQEQAAASSEASITDNCGHRLGGDEQGPLANMDGNRAQAQAQRLADTSAPEDWIGVELGSLDYEFYLPALGEFNREAPKLRALVGASEHFKQHFQLLEHGDTKVATDHGFWGSSYGDYDGSTALSSYYTSQVSVNLGKRKALRGQDWVYSLIDERYECPLSAYFNNDSSVIVSFNGFPVECDLELLAKNLDDLTLLMHEVLRDSWEDKGYPYGSSLRESNITYSSAEGAFGLSTDALLRAKLIGDAKSDGNKQGKRATASHVSIVAAKRIKWQIVCDKVNYLNRQGCTMDIYANSALMGNSFYASLWHEVKLVGLVGLEKGLSKRAQTDSKIASQVSNLDVSLPESLSLTVKDNQLLSDTDFCGFRGQLEDCLLGDAVSVFDKNYDPLPGHYALNKANNRLKESFNQKAKFLAYLNIEYQNNIPILSMPQESYWGSYAAFKLYAYLGRFLNANDVVLKDVMVGNQYLPLVIGSPSGQVLLVSLCSASLETLLDKNDKEHNFLSYVNQVKTAARNLLHYWSRTILPQENNKLIRAIPRLIYQGIIFDNCPAEDLVNTLEERMTSTVEQMQTLREQLVELNKQIDNYRLMYPDFDVAQQFEIYQAYLNEKQLPAHLDKDIFALVQLSSFKDYCDQTLRSHELDYQFFMQIHRVLAHMEEENLCLSDVDPYSLAEFLKAERQQPLYEISLRAAPAPQSSINKSDDVGYFEASLFSQHKASYQEDELKINSTFADFEDSNKLSAYYEQGFGAKFEFRPESSNEYYERLWDSLGYGYLHKRYSAAMGQACAWDSEAKDSIKQLSVHLHNLCSDQIASWQHSLEILASYESMPYDDIELVGSDHATYNNDPYQCSKHKDAEPNSLISPGPDIGPDQGPDLGLGPGCRYGYEQGQSVGEGWGRLGDDTTKWLPLAPFKCDFRQSGFAQDSTDEQYLFNMLGLNLRLKIDQGLVSSLLAMLYNLKHDCYPKEGELKLLVLQKHYEQQALDGARDIMRAHYPKVLEHINLLGKYEAKARAWASFQAQALLNRARGALAFANGQYFVKHAQEQAEHIASLDRHNAMIAKLSAEQLKRLGESEVESYLMKHSLSYALNAQERFDNHNELSEQLIKAANFTQELSYADGTWDNSVDFVGQDALNDRYFFSKVHKYFEQASYDHIWEMESDFVKRQAVYQKSIAQSRSKDKVVSLDQSFKRHQERQRRTKS